MADTAHECNGHGCAACEDKGYQRGLKDAAESYAALLRTGRELVEACKFDGVPIIVRSTRLHSGYGELPLELYDNIRDKLRAFAIELAKLEGKS